MSVCSFVQVRENFNIQAAVNNQAIRSLSHSEAIVTQHALQLGSNQSKADLNIQ